MEDCNGVKVLSAAPLTPAAAFQALCNLALQWVLGLRNLCVFATPGGLQQPLVIKKKSNVNNASLNISEIINSSLKTC